MQLTEYSDKRAVLLNKLDISKNSFYPGIHFLWIDFVTGGNIRSRIHTGIHTHSFFEIQIVFSGNVVYDFGNKIECADSGCAILIPPNFPHRFMECDDNLLKASIAFSVDMPWFNFGNIQKIVLNSISEDINFILQIAESDDIFTSQLVCGRLFEIFYTVCKALDVNLPEKRTISFDSRFIVAKKFIEENCYRIINTEDVARECGLSSKQLNRIFGQNANKSLHEYIVDVRIKTATNMLKNEELSIKEIGYALGFENESGFVSFFKRHCGISPGIYRKTHMSKN